MNEPAAGAVGPGLRERKKRERKQALYRAAADLCLTEGYANVTVEDICERCDVSPRTFFNYFSSKEEAVIGREDVIFDDEDQPAVQDFENGGPSGDLLTDFRILLTSVVATRLKTRDDVKRHLELLRSDTALLQAQLARMDNNLRLFQEMIQRRLRATPVLRQAQDAEQSPVQAQDAGAVRPAQAAEQEDTDIEHRAEVLAGLGVTVLRLTFERASSDAEDAESAVPTIFAELQELFTKETR